MSEADDLIKKGYRRTSVRSLGVSRVDREDWREHMAKEHVPWDPEGEGMSWVTNMGRGAADHYRRVYSNDRLKVSSKEEFRKIPGSGFDPTGFVDLNSAPFIPKMKL